MKPLRVSVLGMDGSGKSSTTLKAILSLSRHFRIGEADQQGVARAISEYSLGFRKGHCKDPWKRF